MSELTKKDLRDIINRQLDFIRSLKAALRAYDELIDYIDGDEWQTVDDIKEKAEKIRLRVDGSRAQRLLVP